MSGFLKPKTWDPEHAQRTIDEEQQRLHQQQQKLQADHEEKQAMKHALGLLTDDSAPSASDTSDDEDSDDGDNMDSATFPGSDTCPMRQYELLQRRYLRAMQEVHQSGERERNNEGLLLKLKLMSKQQTAILKRSVKNRMKTKDKLIVAMLTTMKSLKHDNGGESLVAILEAFEQEHNHSNSIVLHNQEEKNHMNEENKEKCVVDTQQLQEQQQELDVLRMSLSKAEACSASFEAENVALRQSLQDLGNEDPSVLVILKENILVERNQMKAIAGEINILKIEKEEYERNSSQSSKSSKSSTQSNKGAAATTLSSSADAPTASSKKFKSNEQKLLKELKKMASKVKKLEAGKMALMSILKEAQNELTKRKETSPSIDSNDSNGTTTKGETVGGGNSSSGGSGGGSSSSSELKKKDKSIKKLKTQVKTLTSLLREVETKRKEMALVQNSSVEEDLKAAQNEILMLKKQSTSTMDASANHQNKMKQQEEQIKEMGQTLTQYETEISTCKQQLIEMNDLKERQLVLLKDNENKTNLVSNVRRSMKETTAELNSKIEKLRTTLLLKKNAHSTLKTTIVQLSQQQIALSSQLKKMKVDTSDILNKQVPLLISKVSNQVNVRLTKQLKAFQGLADKYKREYHARKKLFNLVQELRGNIRVFCRIRPMNQNEKQQEKVQIITYPEQDENELYITKKDGRHSKYEFDVVFKPGSTNTDVFQGVSDLCMSVLDGYNVCIFAYGQTGSGKTYTMEGPPNDRGINFRSLQRLFELKKEREEEFEYTIEVSLLEIYNENIIDLLVQPATSSSVFKGAKTSKGTKKTASKRTAIKAKLEIKRDPKKGGKGNHVPGLTMVHCNSHEEVLALMAHGYQNRSVHGTEMNAHSSRSHCALSVYVTAQSIIDGSKTKGKLHLIDLAGSERLSKSGAEGDRKKEAQAINKSLSSLGDVISARMSKQKHVPYRNSTLTYLLQDSLGGNSKTLMIVQASPAEYNLSETQATLTWGQRARTVELGKAKKNR